jgi:ubiquinone/menaquinone biosynthesis C-methylase UbiE
MTTSEIGQVRSFWNTEACGTHFVSAEPGTPEFYEQYRRFRYETEWHIPEIVPFQDGKDKHVLEIGCGNGADGVMWAQHGASYTGVDLTDAAVVAARKHFDVLGLPGRFEIQNAEKLTFTDESFDFVYSHGVLHHTRNPQRAFAEVYRVLKPGGRAILMLYHKSSFNYHVRIMGYMRLRLLTKILMRAPSWDADRARLADEPRGIRGNTDPSVWQIHYEQFLRQGWSYLRAPQFVHHCTDGPECPVAYAYTRDELKAQLGAFRALTFRVAHFPLRRAPLGRWIPRALEKRLAEAMGWYLFVDAQR